MLNVNKLEKQRKNKKKKKRKRELENQPPPGAPPVKKQKTDHMQPPPNANTRPHQGFDDILLQFLQETDHQNSPDDRGEEKNFYSSEDEKIDSLAFSPTEEKDPLAATEDISFHQRIEALQNEIEHYEQQLNLLQSTWPKTLPPIHKQKILQNWGHFATGRNIPIICDNKNNLSKVIAKTAKQHKQHPQHPLFFLILTDPDNKTTQPIIVNHNDKTILHLEQNSTSPPSVNILGTTYQQKLLPPPDAYNTNNIINGLLVNLQYSIPPLPLPWRSPHHLFRIATFLLTQHAKYDPHWQVKNHCYDLLEAQACAHQHLQTLTQSNGNSKANAKTAHNTTLIANVNGISHELNAHFTLGDGFCTMRAAGFDSITEINQILQDLHDFLAESQPNNPHYPHIQTLLCQALKNTFYNTYQGNQPQATEQLQLDGTDKSGKNIQKVFNEFRRQMAHGGLNENELHQVCMQPNVQRSYLRHIMKDRYASVLEAEACLLLRRSNKTIYAFQQFTTTSPELFTTFGPDKAARFEDDLRQNQAVLVINNPGQSMGVAHYRRATYKGRTQPTPPPETKPGLPPVTELNTEKIDPRQGDQNSFFNKKKNGKEVNIPPPPQEEDEDLQDDKDNIDPQKKYRKRPGQTGR